MKKETKTDGSSSSTTITSWETQVEQIIRDRLSEKKKQSPSSSPLMVAVAGIPGSGKSTSASILSKLLQPISVILPMDGYHYPLSKLRTFPNPDDVIYRRGAPDTFDAEALKIDLEKITSGTNDTVQIPGFDHAKGDPEPNAHTFQRNNHDIVICEGLYLCHDEDGWEGMNDLFDFKIFVEVDIDVGVERVKKRNKCIPGYTPEEIDIRCEKVDRANAILVDKSKKNADVIVRSAA